MSKFVDHVVEAAKEFCQLPRPSFQHKMQLQDLLLAYLPRMSPKAIAELCNVLAQSKDAPKALILTLCEQPAHICRALLVSSQVLNDDDYIAIIALAENNEHARIIARAPSLSTKLRVQLRALDDERVHRALDLRQQPLADLSAPRNNEHLAHTTTTSVNESEFSALASERVDAIIHTAFADRLGIQLVSAQLLCSDLTSKNLPTALRFMGLTECTAWNLYRRLARSEAYKDGVQRAFETAFRSIEMAEARKLVGEWQIEELVALARHGSAANDATGIIEQRRHSA